MTHSKYDKIKDAGITLGKKHAFLGMVLYFSDAGAFHALQEERVKDIVSLWVEKLKDTDMVITPTSLNLFEKGRGRLLNVEQKENIHSVVAKALFVCRQSRPDMMPTVSILSGRVRDPTTDDGEKGR